jgi:hypothetical protein
LKTVSGSCLPLLLVTGTEVQLASNNNKNDKDLSFATLKKFRLLLKAFMNLVDKLILCYFVVNYIK